MAVRWCGGGLGIDSKAGDRWQVIGLAEAWYQGLGGLFLRRGRVLLLGGGVVGLLAVGSGSGRLAITGAAAELAEACGLGLKGLAELVDRHGLGRVEAGLLRSGDEKKPHAVWNFVRVEHAVAVGVGLLEAFGNVESSTAAPTAAPAASFLCLSHAEKHCGC